MRRRPLLLFAIIAVLAMAAALLLDRAAYTYLYDPGVYDHDWGRMLRTMGFLPFWLAGALALWLHDRARPGQATSGGLTGDAARGAPGRRGSAGALLLALAPTLAGVAGELLKLVIRRERPWAHAGDYVFRSFSDHPLSSGGLAMPSSHSVVAFGAAFALARLFPRTAPVWYVLATGCALTRVAARAHFLSDVTLGALLAWAVVAALWRWDATRQLPA
ncbi:MAG TPA: phosphatase PAP2 family protein [Longimicrobiales bacterium]